MSYTPKTWHTGDTVTATDLNNIENGIANAGSALVCTYTDTGQGYALDKTVQEIYDALESGTPVFIAYTYGTFPTDYVSHTYLAPIIKVFAYEYSNVIRIVATSTVSVTPSTGSGTFLHTPCTVIFSANSLNEYPIFYRTVHVNDTSLTSSEYIY